MSKYNIAKLTMNRMFMLKYKQNIFETTVYIKNILPTVATLLPFS